MPSGNPDDNRDELQFNAKEIFLLNSSDVDPVFGLRRVQRKFSLFDIEIFER
jgi:hypothetical protein